MATPNALCLLVSAISLPVHLYEAYEMICVFQDTIRVIKIQFVLSVAWKFYEIPEQFIFEIQKQSMTFVTNGYTEHEWVNAMGIEMIPEIIWKQITKYCIRILRLFKSRQAALLQEEKYKGYHIVRNLCPIFIKCILRKKSTPKLPLALLTWLCT